MKSKFSSLEYQEIISYNEYDNVRNWLIYLFWDTSDYFIEQNGMATNEDVKIYIKLIEARTDLTDHQKADLIYECNDYIGNEK